MRFGIAAILIVAACDRRAPIGGCDQRLAGAWTTPQGRWMIVDNGKTLEIYPLFDDSIPDGAPRLIDLRRDGKLAGDLQRRFMRRAVICEARAPVTVTACNDDTLQLVIGDVTAPLSYEPCAWPQQAPAHVELWRRD
jgi:hypothetical protein